MSPRSSTGVISALLVVVVGGVAFSACLDDKNKPLGNEVPNRGAFPAQVAIGAGPGPGSGGSGGTSTIGTGGSGGTGGVDLAACNCGASLSENAGCQTCMISNCPSALDDCNNDPQGTCGDSLATLEACDTSACVQSVLAAGDPALSALLACVCSAQCSVDCQPQTVTCQ